MAIAAFLVELFPTSIGQTSVSLRRRRLRRRADLLTAAVGGRFIRETKDHHIDTPTWRAPEHLVSGADS